MNTRKPGRPRATNPRRNRVSASFTDDEMEMIRKAANGDLPGLVRHATLIRAYSAAK
jgi:hypothetical protein